MLPLGVKIHSNSARDDKTVEICMELHGVLLASLKFAGNLNMKGISFFLLTLYLYKLRKSFGVIAVECMARHF